MAFGLAAFETVPDGRGGLLTLGQWVSQTFIQLVMLSVIVVGQNILAPYLFSINESMEARRPTLAPIQFEGCPSRIDAAANSRPTRP